MTTVNAFNDMMEQFINELVKTFPEEPAIKNYQESFEMARMANGRLPLTTFMSNIGPYVSEMQNKDESFFREHAEEIEFLRDTNMKVHWNDSLSENTKNAIWQYLQSLYMIGTTMSMFPPETLSMIESVAENCAKNMKTNQSGQLDEASLMAGMNSMMAQLMNGSGGLAGLLGGAGAGPVIKPKGQRAQPRPGSRRKK